MSSPIPSSSNVQLAEANSNLSKEGKATSSGQLAGLDPQLLSACIHCGLCLPACPTYLATGREVESPRGRIYLMTRWQKGEQTLNDRVAEHLESCLGCLGCQSACPSGVKYETILNQARPHLAKMRDRSTRRLMRFAFAKLLPDYPRLRQLAEMIRWWQKIGCADFLSSLPLIRQAGGQLWQWQSFLPRLTKFKPLPKQSWVSGEKKGQVQLFFGCVMDILYNQVNHACVRLVTAQRFICQVPMQTCCGALAFHAGEEDIAIKLAKQNIELFENTSGDIVVTGSGCAAMLKGYRELFEHNPEWSKRAESFSQRVLDITEFLAANEFASKPNPIKQKVAYHAACHLLHAQKVKDAPRSLLEAVDGLKPIELVESEHCCGSAGIFNLTHTELSLDILKRKVSNISESGAEIIVTTNPGCLLQLEKGIREAGLNIKVYHLAELLDQAYSPT